MKWIDFICLFSYESIKAVQSSIESENYVLNKAMHRTNDNRRRVCVCFIFASRKCGNMPREFFILYALVFVVGCQCVCVYQCTFFTVHTLK